MYFIFILLEVKRLVRGWAPSLPLITSRATVPAAALLLLQRLRTVRRRGGMTPHNLGALCHRGWRGGGLGLCCGPLLLGRGGLVEALHPVHCLEVPLHVTLLIKGSRARRAQVRPRPAVDAHMPLQVVLLVPAVETLAAGGASGEGGGSGVVLLAPLQDKATLRPPPSLPLHYRLHTVGLHLARTSRLREETAARM
ncbi:hypothetical protein E2C01_003178 [Portunus trituberculatus]|uniref:Uncharacterized protein n=1 Tax=Portunus trituberculatus TaxID=210409 RepID=A0A5B7CP26_PORTR|nr:hypothetical protein [Portunus trituberculatus]